MTLEQTHRRTVALDREGDYFFVSMGPVPDKPAWHRELYARQRYPFPKVDAATRFAQAHKSREPARDITIDYPDGRRWDGTRWVP